MNDMIMIAIIITHHFLTRPHAKPRRHDTARLHQ
jgi:hypothetical protein